MDDHLEAGACTVPGTLVLNEFRSEIVNHTALLTRRAGKGEGAGCLEETHGAQHVKPEWRREVCLRWICPP